MNYEIKVFKNKQILAETTTIDLLNARAESPKNRRFNMALAGGNTPRSIYEQWATVQDDRLWRRVHFFWGDERCVPPDRDESNYKMVHDSFQSKIKISDNQIHRIRGEVEPEMEVQRYSDEIKEHLSIVSNFPQFDWILLGLGIDGHTASLFPNSETLEEHGSICVVTQHPQTGQKRISLTLPVINNAKKVTFLVIGEEKAEIIHKIFRDKKNSLNLPAAKIKPHSGILQWYLDEAASSKL
jgi:6-phosphogluconolactonase